jgi:hypothetical protein
VLLTARALLNGVIARIATALLRVIVSLALALGVAALFSFAACSYQLVSPPARMVSLESAPAVAPGETVVGARGAGYVSLSTPPVGVGSVGIRRGVQNGLEVEADATWARVRYDDYPDIDRNIFEGRLGAKLANQAGWGALTAGVGGGFAPAAGGFTAVDIGGVISYPSCFAVPFASATVFASFPIGAKQVDFRNTDGSLAASDTASTTMGFGLGGGLEIPLDRERCRRGLTAARLQVGFALYNLYPFEGTIRTMTSYDGNTTTQERGGQDGAAGLALGVELPF